MRAQALLGSALLSCVVLGACADEKDEELEARHTYNAAVTAFEAEKWDEAAKGFLAARDQAGIDPDLRFCAAFNLGMSYAQAMRHIIMPQALRRILPPLAGQFISLIKDSSLLGIIAIRELTKAAREVVTATLQPFEVYFLAAILYLVLTFTLSMAVQKLEKRMAVS